MAEIINFFGSPERERIEKGETKEQQKQRLLKELYWATIEASGSHDDDRKFEDFISINPRFETITIEEIKKEIAELEGEEE